MNKNTQIFPVTMDIINISSDSIHDWIWNDNFEIGMILEGTLKLQVGNQNKQLHPGDGFFINAQVRHRFINEHNDYVMLYHVKFHPRIIGSSADSIYWQKYIHPLLHNANYPYQIFLRNQDSDTETLEHFMHIFRTLQYRILGYELLVRNELSFVILDLLGRQEHTELSVTNKQLRDEDRIHVMMHYIEENYDHSITVQDLADSAAISISECIRCFKSTLQETPINYVRMFRLVKAADEIIHTNRNISEIAYSCGFQEISYFNRCFKKQYNQTPLQYRQMNQ